MMHIHHHPSKHIHHHHPCPHKKAAVKIKWRINPEMAKANLLEMKGIFDNFRIKFWLTHGTLLGPIREKNFIPHDRDMDLRILAKDWFPKLSEKFEAIGFKATTVRHYPPYVTKIMLSKRKIKTDLALEYYYEPEDVYLCLALDFKEPMVKVRSSFYAGDHFIQFLGTSFRVPYPSEELLEQYYGETWRTPTSAFPGWRKDGKLLNVNEYLKWFTSHPETIPAEMR